MEEVVTEEELTMVKGATGGGLRGLKPLLNQVKDEKKDKKF